MSDVSTIVTALRAEAEFWISVPAGRAADGPGTMIPPMLMRLADRIEALIVEGNAKAFEDEAKAANSILRGRSL